MSGLIHLPSASSSEHLQALAEVSEFALTDMGQPGQGPWPYRRMQEPRLTEELCRRSDARSVAAAHADILSFQPYRSDTSENQDRYVAQVWDLPGGSWVFCAVLDGHVNSHCVEYAQAELPILVQAALRAATLDTEGQRQSPPPETISRLLSDALIKLDDALTSELLRLVPEGVLETPSSPTAQAVQNLDPTLALTSRCLGGATVIFSLLDPQKQNLWVTNLGDCQAVLGVKNSGVWSGTMISNIHNTHAPLEINRIRSEHPDEEECITDGRVLGYLEPTRAVGDTWTKLPKQYTEHFFLHTNQDWISRRTLQRCASQMHSPPYISKTPEVHHHALTDHPSFLILCSDGLKELYGAVGSEPVDHWVTVVGQGIDSAEPKHLSLMLLRDAIGGDDVDRACQLLTVEMEYSWVDDTTLVIQRLRG